MAISKASINIENNIENNIDNCKISQKQARYFAIQIFGGLRQYISEHRAEYEAWLSQEVTENDS